MRDSAQTGIAGAEIVHEHLHSGFAELEQLLHVRSGVQRDHCLGDFEIYAGIRRPRCPDPPTGGTKKSRSRPALVSAIVCSITHRPTSTIIPDSSSSGTKSTGETRPCSG